MKAFVQWLDYALDMVVEESRWVTKPVDASVVQKLASVDFDGASSWWIDETIRKRAVNIFNLETKTWERECYPKLVKKAPAWIHDPLSWQIRWANEVRKGTINEPHERSELHA